jgi:hypothetical protein
MADEQLRRDGLLGESVHLARQRAQQQGGGEPEPEPEPRPEGGEEEEEEAPRAAEVAGLAGGIRDMVRRPLPLLAARAIRGWPDPLTRCVALAVRSDASLWPRR